MSIKQQLIKHHDLFKCNRKGGKNSFWKINGNKWICFPKCKTNIRLCTVEFEQIPTWWRELMSPFFSPSFCLLVEQLLDHVDKLLRKNLQKCSQLANSRWLISVGFGSWRQETCLCIQVCSTCVRFDECPLLGRRRRCTVSTHQL